MDEYILPIVYRDFRTNHITELGVFEWPDIVCILYDENLRGIFARAPHLVAEKCSNVNLGSIEKILFRDPLTQDISIEIFETYYKFTVFGFYQDHTPKKFKVPKFSGIDIEYEKYQNVAFDTSYTNDKHGKNDEEYFGTISFWPVPVCK